MQFGLTPEERFACRRSVIRVEILVALQRSGPLNVRELVALTGAEPRNLLEAIVGDGERYRREHGLEALGLVRRTRVGDPRERARWAITPRGVKVLGEVRRRRRPRT